MDWASGCWQFVGDADALELTARQHLLLDGLKALKQATLTDLARAIGQDRGNTHRRLQDLIGSGLIHREGGYYSLN